MCGTSVNHLRKSVLREDSCVYIYAPDNEDNDSKK